MTEQEWLACRDSSEMIFALTHLDGGFSERKRRLLTAAFIEKAENPRANLKKAILRFAEGNTSGALISQAKQIHERLYASLVFRLRLGVTAGWSSSHQSLKPKQRQFASHLLRDIFGNPFRPVVINPSWLTPTVVSLATAIYDDRGFDRMPILADALEDAGCDNQDILQHCRSGQEHVRGCWVVDLVLGKA